MTTHSKPTPPDLAVMAVGMCRGVAVFHGLLAHPRNKSKWMRRFRIALNSATPQASDVLAARPVLRDSYAVRAVRSEDAGRGVRALEINTIRPDVPCALRRGHKVTTNKRPSPRQCNAGGQVGGNDECEKNSFHDQSPKVGGNPATVSGYKELPFLRSQGHTRASEPRTITSAWK